MQNMVTNCGNYMKLLWDYFWPYNHAIIVRLVVLILLQSLFPPEHKQNEKLFKLQGQFTH